MTQRPVRPACSRRPRQLLSATLAAAMALGCLPTNAQPHKRHDRTARDKALKVSQAAPSAQAAPAPAATSSTRAAAVSREPVTINFVNAEIEAVTRAMAAILGRQILVDPRVKGQMTLYSEQPLSPREAFLNYLATLRGLGYTVVDVNGLLKVVPEADAKLQTSVVSVDAVARSGDQIATQIFRLQHENANNLVTVLRPLISPNNTINASPGNNSLVITDYADNLKRIAKIIAAMDTPATTGVEVIPLKYGVAADLVPIVQRFADSSGAAAGAAPGTVSPGGVQVLADSRTNALLVRAPNTARIAMIRDVVAKLDRPISGAGPTGNIYVVYLKNADATRLATVLRAAYGAGNPGGGTGGSSGPGGSQPTLGSQSGVMNTGLNTGPTGGTSGSGGMSPQATSPVSAAAGPSTGGFIQADPATNALIITAPDPVYRQLRAVIDQLDARRAQVYVESMIVKMDAQKAAEFGFQWQGLLSNRSNNAGVFAGTNYSNGTGANIVNLSIAGATGNASGLSLGSGLNIGLVNKIAGIYTLGALARFLESNTGANVLSTPNLVTLDNEEAKIVIGQNVPFVTGTYATTNTSTSNVNPFQTIERKDVGLTLRIKPQIGENGTVRMVIYQENSSVVANSATQGPTTDKSAIETTVVVDDGQMMVLGGLLKDEYADGEDRVPGLASIPLLGHLFRAENRKRVKTNLLVFLRPVVMRTQEDANQLSFDRYDAIRAQQQANQPRPSAVLPINDAAILPELKRPAPGGPAAPAQPASEPAAAIPAPRPVPAPPAMLPDR